mmetsp:Transcript_2072/g.2624  ORF Transcript_2072/g.2624 Transcript_2072/m.2624 type:complete len:81 (+) Transcript_2072:3927-4169(+)
MLGKVICKLWSIEEQGWVGSVLARVDLGEIINWKDNAEKKCQRDEGDVKAIGKLGWAFEIKSCGIGRRMLGMVMWNGCVF